MKSFDFHAGPYVIFGEHTLSRIGSLAQDLGASRALLVTDPGIAKAGYVEQAVESLRASGLSAFLFSDVDENPTTAHVEAAVSFACSNAPDLIIGLGGGSPMDVAKGGNFLLTNGGKMEDYWGFGKAGKPMLPSIGIPTTSGTGSEAQSYALISRVGTHLKMACGDPKARFKAVILDPVLSVTTPPRVTATSGMDAMGHAIETYVTTAHNPVSQMFSREAWKLLEQNFETALQQPGNIEARSSMLLGAFFAGMAIENSMLGAAHACANPLTARYGMTHGIAVALMLPSVIRFNAPVSDHGYRELSNLTSEKLAGRISELTRIGGLPQNLRGAGVDKEDLGSLAVEAAEQWTAKFNPRPLTETDFLHLYEQAL